MKKLFLFLFVTAAMWQVCVADLPDTVWTRDLWQLGSQIYQVQFTPDGQGIAVAIGGGVYVFDINTGQIVKTFRENIYLDPRFLFSSDCALMIITSQTDDFNQNIISVWNYKEIDTLWTLKDLKYNNDLLIFGSAPFYFTDDSTVIINCTFKNKSVDSNKILTINLKSGKVNKAIGYIGNPIDPNSLAVSNINNKLSFSSGKNSIELWELSLLKIITTLGYHNNYINDLSFSSDGKYLASASSDGIIKIWDVQEKKLVKELKHLDMKDGYLQVKFSPNGGYLVSSGGINFDFLTTVWDLKNFTPTYKYSELIGASGAMDISQDSTKIALGRAFKLFLLNSKWKTTGVNEPPIQNVQVIYPNPSGNNITIPLNQIEHVKKLSITQINGLMIREIDNIPTFINEYEIDISFLSKGSYLIIVSYPTKTVSFKFVKEG